MCPRQKSNAIAGKVCVKYMLQKHKRAMTKEQRRHQALQVSNKC